MVDATVYLFKDIGMDVTYKFVPDFTSKTAQKQWFMTKPHDTYDCNYNKIQNLLYINGVEWGNCIGYTYALLDNVDDSGRTYYAWVRDVTLTDSETVAILLDIDPIQNRMTEWSIGECSVAREHVDRWTSQGYRMYFKANNENPTALMQYQSSKAVCPIDTINNVEVFYATILYRKVVTGSENNTLYIAEMPVAYDGVTDFHPSVGTEQIYPKWYEIMDGSIFDDQGVNPQNVLCIVITQFCPFTKTGSGDTVGFNTASGNGFLGYQRWMEITLTELDITTVLDLFTEYEMEIPISGAVAPDDGALASYTYEPQLYMSPYFKRYIVNGCGSIVSELNDAVPSTENELVMRYKAMISPNSQNIIFDFSEEGDTSELKALAFGAGTLVGSAIIANAELTDIFNDEWLSYSLTSRNTDRQMVVNSAIANTITSTIGMGYGGALVGSRSASGDWDSPDRRNSLLNSGARSAIAMASGAGVAMSVVNAGMAWENQLAKERGIQNQPMKTAQVGTNGIFNMLNYVGQFGFIELRCDNRTWETAFDNYRKYGYEVQRFEKPDIRTRKYYNYIQTNYCKIDGALTGNEKDTISRIINNGVTFVHMDYSTTIGYPVNSSGHELENIERSLIS